MARNRIVLSLNQTHVEYFVLGPNILEIPSFRHASETIFIINGGSEEIGRKNGERLREGGKLGKYEVMPV